MMPTPTMLTSDAGLAATVAWGLDTTTYALEGNINVTGAAVQWLADFIGLDGPAAVAALAEGVESTEGVFLVPAFTGLGAPHWDDQARGLVSGLTRGSTPAAAGAGRHRVDRLPGARRLRGHAGIGRRRPHACSWSTAGSPATSS